MALWKDAISESIVGKRGFFKISSLWLPLALILQTHPIEDLRARLYSSLYLIISIQCWSIACNLVNDLSDKNEDKAAGKKRWIFKVSSHAGILIIILLVGTGLSLIILVKSRGVVMISYAFAMFLGFIYSTRPVRFKERGGYGLLAYSLSATLAYVLVPWTLFHSSLTLLFILIFVVMSDKWVNLHFHQIVDYYADFNSMTRTYAVKVGLERARLSLRIAFLLASFSMIVVIMYILLSEQDITWRMIILLTSIGIIIGTGVYACILKKKASKVSELINELPWFYLGLTYLAFRILPPVIFTHLSVKVPVMWILVTLSCLSLLGESFYMIRYKYE